jgi:hypothetical protein
MKIIHKILLALLIILLVTGLLSPTKYFFILSTAQSLANMVFNYILYYTMLGLIELRRLCGH